MFIGVTIVPGINRNGKERKMKRINGIILNGCITVFAVPGNDG